MHKTLRIGEGVEHGAQRRIKPSTQIIPGRAAHHCRPPPIKKRRRRRARHGSRIPGGQAGRRACFMQRGEGFGGLGVKRLGRRAGIEQRGMGGVAEVFQQHQAGFGIGGDDLGRGKPKAQDMPRNRDEGPRVFRRRCLHHQRWARPAQQPRIAPG